MSPSAAVSPQTENTADPSLSERLEPEKMDIYKGVPETTGNSVTDTKDDPKSVVSVATHVLDVFKASYADAAKGVMSYNVKVIEIAHANISATIDHFHEIFAVTSLPELIKRSTANMRKQVELFSAQTQDLLGLGRKAFADTAESIKPDVKKYD